MSNKKIISFVLIFSLIFFYFSPCFAYSESYTWSTLDNSIETSSSLPSSNEILDNNSLNLEAGSAILIEQNSGQILYGYNIHEALHPASVTKVMSLLLIMEALDSGKITLDTQIPCSDNAASMGGSQIWLNTTETLTVDEMLKAIAIVSANDCVVAMAEYLGGTEEGFVQMMNDKAKELGMNDTTFKNCHGLDEDGHLTSAYDIALMSRELLTKHPSITNYTTIWMDSLRDGKSTLSSTNKLVRNYSGCTGLKTGSTSLALYNLSASATRDGLSLFAVIMKAPTSAIRFDNATKLLDYGFANFSYSSFGEKGDIVKSVSVNKGTEDSVNIVYENSASILLPKGSESNVTYEINLPDYIQAPITQGQVIGTVSYILNDEVIATINLVTGSSINKINIFSMSKTVYSSWLSLLRT